MLIRSFQIAENQWAIKECLAAACSLCEDRESRLSLLRHGILAAVQRSVLQSSLMEVQNRAQHSAESPTAPAMCASLLASFSRCHASRISLCENPQTALLLVNVLRTQTTRVHSITLSCSLHFLVGFWLHNVKGR